MQQPLFENKAPGIRCRVALERATILDGEGLPPLVAVPAPRAGSRRGDHEVVRMALPDIQADGQVQQRRDAGASGRTRAIHARSLAATRPQG